jgi:hypothetical protein
MKKHKLLMMVLMSLGLTGILQAAEVISIDINNYGNDVAYSGEAAVEGATEWVVYYGGWGVPLGSPRSANLAEARAYDPENDDPYPQSTYAAQVWAGDLGGHDYVTGAGDGLLDDGFASFPAGGDPNIFFIGTDLFPQAADHAYGGTFDMYVYGNSAGDFYLTDPNGIVIAGPNSITGTETAGVFESGKNYVVFEDVSIADPENSVLLWYTNELNAIQLVSPKTPFVVSSTATDPNDYTIVSTEWDVAFDTNARDDETEYGFGSYYGPDTYPGVVGILYTGDWMLYDLVVNPADKGQYNLSIDIFGDYTGELDLYLDENPIGTLSDTSAEPLLINLFAGMHTLRWESTGYHGDNVGGISLVYAGDITLEDCDDVYKYGYNLAGDLNRDCRVNLEDLVLIAAEWAQNYNPFQ